jgi:hypothetical protein
MTVLLSPVGGVAAQFFDNNGNPLSGGKLFSYAAGTTTPAATYTSSLGITAHTNPIVLDSGGRVPGGEIWLTDGIIYKFVLQTSTNVLIATYDNIVGINSNFVNYTTEQEIQTATAGQTVFNLTTTQYQPGTNSLTVYVDGVNQYGPGAQYAYLETDGDTVTFVSGLHVGASVKFTTATQTTGNATNASVVAYEPPFTGSVGTTVEDKLAQYVSVKDFGAVGDGVVDDADAIQAALDAHPNVYVPPGTYLSSKAIKLDTGNTLFGAGIGVSTIKWTCAADLPDRPHFITNKGTFIDNQTARETPPWSNRDYFIGVGRVNLTVQDLTVDMGRTVGGTMYRAIGIAFVQSSQILVQRCEVVNSFGPQGISMFDSNEVVIKNNYIHEVYPDITVGPFFDGWDGSGIICFHCQDFDVSENSMLNIWDSGIGYDSCDRGVIYANRIVNYGQYGISTFTATNVQIWGNYLKGNPLYLNDTTYNSRSLMAFDLDDGTNFQEFGYNISIHDNICETMKLCVRIFANANFALGFDQIKVYNNTFKDITPSTLTLPSLFLVFHNVVNDQNIEIYNNTIYEINLPYPNTTAFFFPFNITTRTAVVGKYKQSRVVDNTLYLGTGTYTGSGGALVRTDNDLCIVDNNHMRMLTFIGYLYEAVNDPNAVPGNIVVTNDKVGVLTNNGSPGSVAIDIGEAKAFINFDGRSVSLGIRSEHNMTFTRTGVGTYTINFITPMRSANYVILGTCNDVSVQGGFVAAADTVQTASSFNLITYDEAGAPADMFNINLAVFHR